MEVLEKALSQGYCGPGRLWEGAGRAKPLERPVGSPLKGGWVPALKRPARLLGGPWPRSPEGISAPKENSSRYLASCGRQASDLDRPVPSMSRGISAPTIKNGGLCHEFRV